MRKKIIIILVCLCVLLSFLFISKKDNTEEKLLKVGFDRKEVKIILNKVSKDNYKYIKTYNSSLIDIINSKDYKDNKLKDYLNYYEKNSNENINNIITIVNSNYDLSNYPASDLLASLVKEKYYINNNVARYLDYGNNHDASTKKIISIVNSNADKDFYSLDLESNVNDNNLILVNKFYHLSNDYVPSDLVSISGKYNKGKNNLIRKEAYEAFVKMVDAALLDNIIIYNMSAYRSYEYQNNLYNNYSKLGNPDNYSARPGYSEHQTGLCLDVNKVDDSFDNTNESNWLKNNAYKYGFILRFPKDKEDITGYKYEPWHYRYVGLKASKIIHKENITLEEYYAYYVKS